MKKLTLYVGALLLALTSQAQTVTTFAGKVNTDPTNNYSNTTASLSTAYFNMPEGIAWDNSGNMYVTERHKIRLLLNGKAYNRSGTLGSPSTSLGYKDGTGIASQFYSPTSAVCDASGNVYIVDSENHAIRKLSKFVNTNNGQILSTFAGATTTNPTGGQGTPGHKDATGTAARFDTPTAITMDKNGVMYVVDSYNHCIRKVSASGAVVTLAGKPGSFGNTDGTGSAALFDTPYGIAMYDDNNVVVTDYRNMAIRKVNTSTGTVTTICGKFGNQDGSFSVAGFRAMRGIAVVNGLIYVADGSRIRVIDEANKTVSTFAGSGSQTGNTDGTGSDARFGSLYGMAYDGGNALYVTDHSYHIIRKVTIDNLAPAADFSVTKTNIEINEETTVKDISGGKPATVRNWTIEAQNGGTSNVVIVQGDVNKDESITVKFTATGVYKVTLKVTNEYGSDEVTKSIINVSTVGVNEVNKLAEVQLFPNPAKSGLVNLVASDKPFSNTAVSVLNNAGQEVLAETIARGRNHKMDISGLAPGIYFVRIADETRSGTKRLIIQ